MTSVTIAVPVFNGGEMLEECLHTLQTQTFTDFQVIVFDNASTDQTAEIARDFASADKRFAYQFNATNIGALANFTRALDATKSELFLWRAHDDLCNADYLRKLVQALNENPTAVLSAPRVHRQRIRHKTLVNERTVAFKHSPCSRAFDRFAQDARINMHQGWFYGVWRREAIARIYHHVVAQFPYAWASDVLILLGALASGDVTGSDEAVFIQRIVKKSTQDQAQAAPRKAEILYDQRRLFKQITYEYVLPLTNGPRDVLALHWLIDRLTSKRVGSRSKLMSLKFQDAISRDARGARRG